MQLPQRWSRTQYVTALQLIGLCLLAYYFARYGITLEPLWIFAYLALGLAIAIAYGALMTLLERLLPSQQINFSALDQRIFAPAMRNGFGVFLLLPGEDGIFCVPLLLVGITPITSDITAILFAGLHFPLFTAKHCVAKAVFFFAVALIVLPHGLAAVVVGHLLQDAISLALWSRLRSHQAAEH